MCFSATASFGAGVVLTVISVATIRKVKRPSQFAFASIPILFAFQQCVEGILWLSLTYPEYASFEQVSTYAFLFIAQVVWPIWVPFSILMATENAKRTIIGKVLVLVGGVVSLYLGYCLFTYHVDAKVIGYHIAYNQHYPALLGGYSGILYVIATIVPPFFSPIKHMWALGTAILISYIVTMLFYTDYMVSVWCFFASIISISVYLIMRRMNAPR